MYVCVCFRKREAACGCVLVHWAPQSRVPGGKNAAITPLVKEGGRPGCRERAEGVKGRAREGGEGKEGGWNTADLANNSK